MNEGQLLYCNNASCFRLNRHGKHVQQVLGRVIDSGEVAVIRFNSGTTLIKCDHYQISCGCGFSYLISGTTIEGTIMLDINQI